VVIDGQSYMLEVLDTAGQEEYTALRDQWIRDGEAFLLVYSVSSRSSFTRIYRFHAQVLRVKESSGSDNYYSLPGPPICLLVGNKSDSEYREISTIEGHNLPMNLVVILSSRPLKVIRILRRLSMTWSAIYDAGA
jgi:GTPase KRas protein